MTRRLPAQAGAYSESVGRKTRELAKLSRFTAVGTAAFIVDLAVFNLLMITVLQGRPVWSKTIAVICATTLSWIGSRVWTFADQGSRYRPALEAVMFFAVNAAGMGIALLTLWVSHDVLGYTSLLADNISGNVIGMLLGNIMRYFAYRSWLFRARPESKRRVEGASYGFDEKRGSAPQDEQRDGELS